MDMKTLWLGWRRDLSRLVVLCLIAVSIGVLVNHARASARRSLEGLVPGGALDGLAHDLKGLAADRDVPAGHRLTAPVWMYHTRIAPGQQVWIRGLRGAISVEAARGDSLDVTAVKTYGASDPSAVTLVATPGPRGVIVCAMWGADGHCSGSDDYRQGKAQDNDVAVAFTVRVPRGVRVDASTVTGAVHITGASAPVVAQTVDGAVTVETSAGPVDVRTVNGSVHALIRGFAESGPVKVGTVNGSVTVELPARLDARVEANTMNGSVESDFPLTSTDKFAIRHATGTVGAGGRQIELHAINGSVRIKALR
jgi:hypothetical protein